jgi:diketogulonate reductase-like aldo/keto reductase
VQNETEVGDAIREFLAHEPNVQREDIFVTSKLSPYEQGQQAARGAIDGILHRLDLGHVDALLVHWPGTAKISPDSPVNAERRKETWRALEDAFKAGKCRAIGVSNYDVGHLAELLEYAVIPPAINQVEVHPLWPQTELLSYCARMGIAVCGYAPFASGALLNPAPSKEVLQVAQRCGKTPAQVLCCWGLQKGLAAVLPKSIQPERIAELSPRRPEMQADASEKRWLSQADEAVLDALGADISKRKKFCWDPSKVS